MKCNFLFAYDKKDIEFCFNTKKYLPYAFRNLFPFKRSHACNTVLIAVKRNFHVLFDTVVTGNVHYLEENNIGKIQKKKSLKIRTLRNPDRFSKKSL